MDNQTESRMENRTGQTDFRQPYLDLLNDQQRAAVVYKDGPALVIAGAGSGKTRVLTYKIVDLLNAGFNPSRIMALTFTNKAAREMKERIEAIVGQNIASRLWMGTFHSIFLRILRRHPEEIGYRSNFTIYDSSDSKSLIKAIVKDLGLDEKAYKPATIASLISNAKNSLISAAQYVADPENAKRDGHAQRPMLGTIYRLYTERCRLAQAMDFDDILFNMNLLLRDYPAIRRHYQEFFQYLLVDEYQDTNFAQALIVRQLTSENQNLCVVGDDAQSIYSFRGANISNILNLNKQYPSLKIFKLERNYRSTQNIINAAGSLIAKNTRQMPKNVFSENEEGERVKVIYTYTDLDEAFLTANMISQYRMEYHSSLDEFAILYRTNAQSRVLEESLRRRNIAYRIYGGLSFYQRKEIKDATSYFRLALNPHDDEALRRVINFPARGIGETTLKKLQSKAIEDSVSIWEVIDKPDLHPAGLNNGTLKKLALFHDLISEFIEDNGKGADAYELGRLIINRTALLSSLAHDNTPEAISRQENLSELLAGLKEFVSTHLESGEPADMNAFLSEISLATDQDSSEEDDQPKVTLMTVHAAKGLEFSHIFIVGVEEDLFPSMMAKNSQSEIEEERRLLYVAITRAKKTCVITYAGSRFRNGQTAACSPSRFLSDMNPRYLKIESSNVIPNPSSGFSRQPSRFGRTETRGYRTAGNRNLKRVDSAPAPSIDTRPTAPPGEVGYHNLSDLSIGLRILHPLFGQGEITDFVKVSNEDAIMVNFSQVGLKKMLLRFAKFQIISSR